MKWSNNKYNLLLGILLIIISLNALAGGFYGITGAKGVPTEWLTGSPFRNYFLPALFLMVVIGGSTFITALLVLGNSLFAKQASIFCGILILLWLAVQVSIIGYVSWMQPATAIAAVLVLLMGTQIKRYAY